MRICVWDRCKGSVEHLRPNAKYCSKRCKKAHSRKKNYDANREYYAEYARNYKINNPPSIKLSDNLCACGCGDHPRRNRTWINGHQQMTLIAAKPEKTIEEKAARSKALRGKKYLRKYTSRKNYVMYLWKGAVGRAKDVGRPVDQSYGKEIAASAPDACPVCSELLDYTDNHTSLSPSLDRLDNSKGYVVGNVKVICYGCNTVKGIGTAEQHERIAAWMRRETTAA